MLLVGISRRLGQPKFQWMYLAQAARGKKRPQQRPLPEQPTVKSNLTWLWVVLVGVVDWFTVFGHDSRSHFISFGISMLDNDRII